MSKVKVSRPLFVLHSDKADLDFTKPIVYGSTGTWTLLVPIKVLDKFKIMNPDNEKFPEILIENRRSSIHPICFDTYDKKDTSHPHTLELSGMDVFIAGTAVYVEEFEVEYAIRNL